MREQNNAESRETSNWCWEKITQSCGGQQASQMNVQFA